jgi:capsular exopolysaccharide synthesis family protein
VDRRLRTVQEADLALPARVLAAIPQPLGPVTAAALPRAAELFPLSIHSEAYRFLAVNLLGAREQGVRSVMMASAKADQGSTITMTNLAITLAQAGQRVVVVDANLRTPQVHQVFGMSNTCGFSTLLRRPDAATLEQALQPTTVPNLRVITSGPDNGNPWELFRSENLREVTRRLEDLADYVLYDTPSALAFTDALNLAPAVDAALLCVRALEPTSGAAVDGDAGASRRYRARQRTERCARFRIGQLHELPEVLPHPTERLRSSSCASRHCCHAFHKRQLERNLSLGLLGLDGHPGQERLNFQARIPLGGN